MTVNSREMKVYDEEMKVYDEETKVKGGEMLRPGEAPYYALSVA